MDDFKAFLIGVSEQDQLKTRIAEKWAKSDQEVQEEIIEWFETSTREECLEALGDMPWQWITFIQGCAIAGLRQAVLEQEAD